MTSVPVVWRAETSGQAPAGGATTPQPEITVIEVHLIGYTSDLRHLVLDLGPDAPGRYRLVVDGDLFLTVDEVRELRRRDGLDVGVDYVPPAGDGAEPQPPPVPDTAEAAGPSKPPEPPETPEAPETSETPEPPESSETPEPPETSETPETPVAPEAARALEGGEPPEPDDDERTGPAPDTLFADDGQPPTGDRGPSHPESVRLVGPDEVDRRRTSSRRSQGSGIRPRLGAFDDLAGFPESETPDAPQSAGPADEEAQRDAPRGNGGDPPAEPEVRRPAARPPAGQDSDLTPAEIQALLRAGRSARWVAEQAGTDVAWVERWLPPIAAERSQVLEQALAARLDPDGRGPSKDVLATAVGKNLRERKVEPDDAAWKVRRRRDGRWSVNLRFPEGDRTRSATWRLDRETGALRAASPLARRLGWTGAARSRNGRSGRRS